MSTIQTFEDLTAWQKAHALVLDVYRVTQAFPTDERYGLTSQLRRAAISIPSNIAEGFTRAGIQDKIRFYNIAEASTEEVRYQLFLSHELHYSNTSNLQELAKEVKRIIRGLIKSLNSKNNH